MDTRTIALMGVKGGVGTSTTAARIAVAACVDQQVNLYAPNMDDFEDLLTILAQPESDRTYVEVRPSLTVSTIPKDGVLNVIDLGRNRGGFDHLTFDAFYMVLRNDYLSLKRALKLPSPTGYLMINEPERPLNARDAGDVLGMPVETIEHNASVARMVDAGLLAMNRFPLTVPEVLRAERTS